MRLLEEKIVKDGVVKKGNVLKVDSFLNHQMDVVFLSKLAKEFHRLFKNEQIDRILTIESSGIGIACLVAQLFEVPLVFAKKSKTSNISDNLYSSQVASFTHGVVNTVVVSKEFLKKGENVLIIDDFLACGQAVLGLSDIVNQAGAKVSGVGIVIEKSFQEGRGLIEEKGIRVESLARIKSMDEEKGIEFVG